MKPSPPDIQALYLGSLQQSASIRWVHDIRFVEDNWGAADARRLGPGLGSLVLNGMEVTQLPIFQQVGGIEVGLVAERITSASSAWPCTCSRKGIRVRSRLVAPVRPRCDLRRRVPGERSRAEPLQLHARRHRDAVPPLRRPKANAGTCWRRTPSCRCRPRAHDPGLARVQPARRARRHLGDQSGQAYILRVRELIRRAARRGSPYRRRRPENGRIADRVPVRGNSRAHAGATAERTSSASSSRAGLKTAGLSFDAARAFATPRRRAWLRACRWPSPTSARKNGDRGSAP